ncbi:hypothetical protein Dtox_0015 [Desulfofarcimen acetoxidans DSM 771]|uniref:Preprotein translocase subunit SecB n=1 Tax=Desulfofarcimen acetoxidans (strain ATCC 49208 / DSM 771 / KCTC 5769 / VKM B-1644 / 5575) TaxID=485916 RepID=C8VVB0_DESAS|nr:protein-export chaperone SecB [Desulfofarcimen acetoxidans]ACV60979.1 hypothetical protein Dtox_0015 [Desulfofarcimen acetoxidans DSM 771]
MDNQLVSVFKFIDYKVDYINFKLNSGFTFEEPIDIDFDLRVEMAFNSEKPKGKITINAIVFDNAEENRFPFFLDIAVTGLFAGEDGMPIEEFRKYCETSGTAAMFPFLRSAIADITRTANIESLILPIINIRNLMKKDVESKT